MELIIAHEQQHAHAVRPGGEIHIQITPPEHTGTNGDDVHIEIGHPEEGKSPPHGINPAEEYDTQQLTPWPYRDGCPHCTRGRGMGNKHRLNQT